MIEGRVTRVLLRVWVALVLLFLFVPIALIVLYAFNKSNVQGWPPSGLSTRWISVAWHDAQVRSALERVQNGTYGTCARCGKPIEPRRLVALPYATLCRSCEEAVEREGQA